MKFVTSFFFSTHATIKDFPDMKTQLVVTFGATEIKDWDGTEKSGNGKLVIKTFYPFIIKATVNIVTKNVKVKQK